MATAETMTTSAIGSECWAPCSVRDTTSRLSASVPSQCAALGGASRLPAIVTGSSIGHHWTVRATTTQKATRNAPAMTGVVSQLGRTKAGRTDAESAMTGPPSPEPDARIDEGVSDVGHQVGEKEGGAADDRDAD